MLTNSRNVITRSRSVRVLHLDFLLTYKKRKRITFSLNSLRKTAFFCTLFITLFRSLCKQEYEITTKISITKTERGEQNRKRSKGRLAQKQHLNFFDILFAGNGKPFPPDFFFIPCDNIQGHEDIECIIDSPPYVLLVILILIIRQNIVIAYICFNNSKR